jgi:hypothetical protein
LSYIGWVIFGAIAWAIWNGSYIGWMSSFGRESVPRAVLCCTFYLSVIFLAALLIPV